MSMYGKTVSESIGISTTRLPMTITLSLMRSRTISLCTQTKAIALIAAWRWEVCDGIYRHSITQAKLKLFRILMSGRLLSSNYSNAQK